MRRYFILTTKKCRIYAAFGVSQTPNNYSKVKGDLFIRLLNKKKHEKALENAVYKEVDGIACVLYMKVGQRDGCISSMKIHKASLADWGMDEDEAYENALSNTYSLTPPRIYKWERLLFNPAYEGEDFMDMNYEENIVERNAGSCLSTSIRTNGAVAVFLPDVAQRIADLMDDDFYIVFTSVHEAMIHPKRMSCPEDLERILKETLKEATPDEDFLTDEIYYYDRGARKIMKWKKVVSKVTLPASCVERLPL